MVGLQTQVNQRADLGIAGQLYDMDAYRAISLQNANNVLMLYTVTVNAAADVDYSLTLTNPLGEVLTATFNQGVAGIVENKVDGMVAAINNTIVLSSRVRAVKTGAATFTVQARLSNITGVITTDANSTPVLTTAAVADSAIPFGLGIVFGDAIGLSGVLPSDPAAFARYTSVVGAAAAAGTYITVVAGTTFTYTGGAAETVTTIRDGLIALINASDAVAGIARAYVVAADEYAVVGLTEAPLVVTVAAGTGSGQTLTTVNAGSAGEKIIGVSMRTLSQANDTKYDLAGVNVAIAGIDGYPVGSSMSILTRGSIFVQSETAVNVAQPVYVRSVAGAGEQLGAFRSTVDGSDLQLVPNARWVRGTAAAGLAVVEFM